MYGQRCPRSSESNDKEKQKTSRKRYLLMHLRERSMGARRASVTPLFRSIHLAIGFPVADRGSGRAASGIIEEAVSDRRTLISRDKWRSTSIFDKWSSADLVKVYIIALSFLLDHGSLELTFDLERPR